MTKLQGAEPTVFHSFDDFSDLLPITLTLTQAIKRSYRDKFPRAHRWGSQKARPMFKRSDLISWVQATFSEACPELAGEFESEIRKRKGSTLTPRAKGPKRSGKHDKAKRS